MFIISYIMLTDVIKKLLVVEDTLRSLRIPQHSTMVVDHKTGIREITTDIHRGRIRLGQLDSLVLLVGRADIVRGHDIGKNVDRFVKAVELFGSNTRVLLAGPIPRPRDHIKFIRSIQDSSLFLREKLLTNPHVEYRSAILQLYNQNGMVSLYDDDGNILQQVVESIQNKLQLPQ